MIKYSEQQVEDGLQLGAVAVVIVIGVAMVVLAIANYYGVQL